jgi:hypothetical protein
MARDGQVIAAESKTSRKALCAKAGKKGLLVEEVLRERGHPSNLGRRHQVLTMIDVYSKFVPKGTLNSDQSGQDWPHIHSCPSHGVVIPESLELPVEGLVIFSSGGGVTCVHHVLTCDAACMGCKGGICAQEGYIRMGKMWAVARQSLRNQVSDILSWVFLSSLLKDPSESKLERSPPEMAQSQTEMARSQSEMARSQPEMARSLSEITQSHPGSCLSSVILRSPILPWSQPDRNWSQPETALSQPEMAQSQPEKARSLPEKARSHPGPVRSFALPRQPAPPMLLA